MPAAGPPAVELSMAAPVPVDRAGGNVGLMGEAERTTDSAFAARETSPRARDVGSLGMHPKT
eukprot:3492806-Pleurochrysis_carterae.AAC.1